MGIINVFTQNLKLAAENCDVAFICGSDEHGVPITLKAKKEGINRETEHNNDRKIMKNNKEIN